VCHFRPGAVTAVAAAADAANAGAAGVAEQSGTRSGADVGGGGGALSLTAAALSAVRRQVGWGLRVGGTRVGVGGRGGGTQQ
jgi:hypothetical protein